MQKTKKIAINGFGRIGRLVFRDIFEEKDIEIVAINDLTNSQTLAHLLKYDTAHRKFNHDVTFSENNIIVDEKIIPIFSEKDPKNLPWKSLDVDVVVEATGRFTTEEGASLHIEAGAKKVIITAPSKGSNNVKTIVYSVNENILTNEDKIISTASCTTNCLAPIANILNKEYKIKKGFMTTVHAYTADQNLQDGPHRDLRRARAAAMNIVPTTTGAAKAIGLVIPELAGVMDGIALRVPTVTGSIVDLTLELEKEPTVKEINELMKQNASESLIFTDEPIVSSDIIGSHGAWFDSLLTSVIEVDGKKLYKVFGWYDNEQSFVSQYVRVLKHVLELK
ncbi:type I glyceraldehyde-3-phosphate dehydrogenase [Mycoplasma zalophi]|uniref:Type I glyceraldehyde-3-phosphate dehydrogenase n=1 Tax=Mycoplasma zalophi TaxID=191287 RepID=A0ABS6DQ30_9MOLU|nr:type I glyceraldehyde-3-phosphate dehydrogenase [Mycoplasma zalophi]MBU4690796.1 type I glyceraldehyde-3-phosphate dehydrogenase [Mycoplasma zalophi]MBU4692388.1 type I glyceraldehyde-3-phosphate dehydrogenase [Mycoplasma zalophi]